MKYLKLKQRLLTAMIRANKMGDPGKPSYGCGILFVKKTWFKLININVNSH